METKRARCASAKIGCLVAVSKCRRHIQRVVCAFRLTIACRLAQRHFPRWRIALFKMNSSMLRRYHLSIRPGVVLLAIDRFSGRVNVDEMADASLSVTDHHRS